MQLEILTASLNKSQNEDISFPYDSVARVKLTTCQHGFMYPEALDAVYGLQKWSVAVDLFNELSGTAHKGHWGWTGAKNLSSENYYVTKCTDLRALLFHLKRYK